MLSDMLVFSDIEVLANLLKVDSLDLHNLLDLNQNLLNCFLLLLAHLKVLSSGWNSQVVGRLRDLSQWSLLNTVSGESIVDVGTEVSIVESELLIISLVSLGKRLELFVGKLEVEHAENSLKLVFENSSLSELIEIVEKFLDSDPLHDDLSSDSLLNV